MIESSLLGSVDIPNLILGLSTLLDEVSVFSQQPTLNHSILITYYCARKEIEDKLETQKLSLMVASQFYKRTSLSFEEYKISEGCKDLDSQMHFLEDKR